MNKLKTTLFETQVIGLLLKGEDPVLHAIRAQYQQVTKINRELTGYGFYLHFYLPPNIARLYKHLPIKPSFSFGDVEAVISSLENGVGFLLWVKDGLIDMLEAYTYDEAWPESITEYELKYISGENLDWNYLHKQWNLDLS